MDLGGYSIFVMGYPRSGTTMIMRMLGAAGIELLQEEGWNPINRFDPHGVAEFKDVGTELHNHDKEWTKDKAIKLVTLYLEFLPLDRPIKVIFTIRDQTEIITSLLAKKLIIDEDIAWSIKNSRDFLALHKVPVLYLQYREVIKYPKSTSLQIAEFLDKDLDIDAMAKVVDRSIRTRHDGDIGGFVNPTIEEYANAEIRAITILGEEGLCTKE